MQPFVNLSACSPRPVDASTLLYYLTSSHQHYITLFEIHATCHWQVVLKYFNYSIFQLTKIGNYGIIPQVVEVHLKKRGKTKPQNQKNNVNLGNFSINYEQSTTNWNIRIFSNIFERFTIFFKRFAAFFCSFQKLLNVFERLLIYLRRRPLSRWFTKWHPPEN